MQVPLLLLASAAVVLAVRAQAPYSFEYQKMANMAYKCPSQVIHNTARTHTHTDIVHIGTAGVHERALHTTHIFFFWLNTYWHVYRATVMMCHMLLQGTVGAMGERVDVMVSPLNEAAYEDAWSGFRAGETNDPYTVNDIAADTTTATDGKSDTLPPGARNNTNLRGGDIAGLDFSLKGPDWTDASGSKQCADFCANHSQCKAWVYVRRERNGPRCAIKVNVVIFC